MAPSAAPCHPWNESLPVEQHVSQARQWEKTTSQTGGPWWAWTNRHFVAVSGSHSFARLPCMNRLNTWIRGTTDREIGSSPRVFLHCQLQLAPWQLSSALRALYLPKQPGTPLYPRCASLIPSTRNLGRGTCQHFHLQLYLGKAPTFQPAARAPVGSVRHPADTTSATSAACLPSRVTATFGADSAGTPSCSRHGTLPFLPPVSRCLGPQAATRSLRWPGPLVVSEVKLQLPIP